MFQGFFFIIYPFNFIFFTDSVSRVQHIHCANTFSETGRVNSFFPVLRKRTYILICHCLAPKFLTAVVLLWNVWIDPPRLPSPFAGLNDAWDEWLDSALLCTSVELPVNHAWASVAYATERLLKIIHQIIHPSFTFPLFIHPSICVYIYLSIHQSIYLFM